MRAFVGSLMATAAFMVVFLPGVAFGANPPFGKGPYLHDLGPTTVDIRVELDTAQPIAVEFSPTGDGAEGGAPRRVESKDARVFHDVHIDGLEPGRRYGYTVRAGKSAQSGTFTTAPKDDSTAPFAFLVYGDNRTDPVAHAAVVRAMLPTPSDFLVHTGDFVEDGRDPEGWQSFFDVESEMLRDRCLYPCVGNHELLEKGGENYLRFFGTSPSAGEPPRMYETFRWGDARFFLLNGQDEFTNGPETVWLRDALARAANEPGLIWRFAVVHFGYRSAGPHGDNPRLLVARIDELLKANKVDLVFSGHDHIYERGEEKGMRYVVSGGGGAPLYRIKTPLASTRKVESTYHFVAVDVAPTLVKLTAKRADGSIMDTCSFGKSAGWDCDPKTPAPSSVATDPAPRDDASHAASSRCGCAANGAAASSAPFVALAALGLLALRRRFRYARG